MHQQSRLAPRLRALDRINVRQMSREATKRSALIATSPDFTGRRSKVQSRRIPRVGGHRLPLHGPPGLRLRQTLIETLPRPAAVTRAVYSRPTARRCTRPNRRAVHRKNPERFGIARMHDDRKPDVPDALRHCCADFLPFLVGSIDSENAAMVLLIQPIRMAGGETHAVWVVSEFGAVIRKEIGASWF